MNYEYNYIEVKTRGVGADDYKNIINEQAKKGWRLVTAIDRTLKTVAFSSNTLDLVFEREIKEHGRSQNDEKDN